MYRAALAPFDLHVRQFPCGLLSTLATSKHLLLLASKLHFVQTTGHKRFSFVNYFFPNASIIFISESNAIRPYSLFSSSK